MPLMSVWLLFNCTKNTLWVWTSLVIFELFVTSYPAVHSNAKQISTRTLAVIHDIKQYFMEVIATRGNLLPFTPLVT